MRRGKARRSNPMRRRQDNLGDGQKETTRKEIEEEEREIQLLPRQKKGGRQAEREAEGARLKYPVGLVYINVA
jgi:hypothetical protein